MTIYMHGYCDECGGTDCESVECEHIRTNLDAERLAWRPPKVTSVGGAELLDVILRLTLSSDPRARRVTTVSFTAPARSAYVLDPGHYNPFECRTDPWVDPPFE